MSKALVAPDVLAGLKDFQRATVDYVFERLYRDPSHSGRFLVADEVGLGKTMIARGVIARAIDHLREQNTKRIDVIYICSNGDIARQNINRLKVGDEQHIQLASRLTLLPQEVEKLNSSPSGVNFISFTPATSFQLAGGLGRSSERVLLYWMLRHQWQFGDGRAPMNVLRGNVTAERFRRKLEGLDPETLKQSHAAFGQVLAKYPALKTTFETLCTAYSRSDRVVADSVTRERYQFIGRLRTLLATSCVEALEPDLIVLDEFQRFSELLDGEDDAASLARELFTFANVRVLCLSATPYKMYTHPDDSGGEDHYRDFARTIRFLEGGARDDKALDAAVNDYRESLLQLGAGSATVSRVSEARDRLENRLRRVMVRTERLAATPDRSGMLAEMPRRGMDVRAADLIAYVGMQRIAREVQADDTVELWKSAPFVLHFADDGYKLRRQIRDSLATPDGRVRLALLLGRMRNALLPWAQAEQYAAIDHGNARLRALADDVIERGAWRLLWVPPSLPYYALGGAFATADLAGFTKRLVFSSWRVVPRAIASLISYEVERRMAAGDPEMRNTPEARRRRRGLLRFALADGRLVGMPVLALLYPSLYLARACDPAVLLRERIQEETTDDEPHSIETIELEKVLAIARERISVGLERLGDTSTDGHVDERWYWAAPLLLDRQLDPKATRAWFEQPDLARHWSGEEDEEEEDDGPAQESRVDEDDPDHWRSHVEEAYQVAVGGRTGANPPLGRMPEDLVDVLAELAVAGPAVATFRALDRVVGGEHALSANARTTLRNGAGRIAWSFRALFNQPDVVSMLRGGARGRGAEPYWRQVLRYCAEGCLAAVLDEYVHVLRDHLGLLSGDIEEKVHEIAEEIRDSVELRTSRVAFEDYVFSEAGRTVKSESRNLRTHFALRFDNEKSEEDGGESTRSDQVRKAFNSPFWPFVLATTSVGQEGLDFHPYCHAVVHWNLPSNPVDLEQREGRVHRYKGHAVRKNVAQQHGWTALETGVPDPWEAMFDLARAAAAARGESEIAPFWVYPVENGARIERHMLTLPLSREHVQAADLRRSLAIYRMVFGQPRQDDLVRFLLERVPAEEREKLMGEARIDLTPPRQVLSR